MDTKKTVQDGTYIFHLVDFLPPVLNELLVRAMQSTGSREELTCSQITLHPWPLAGTTACHGHLTHAATEGAWVSCLWFQEGYQSFSNNYSPRIVKLESLAFPTMQTSKGKREIRGHSEGERDSEKERVRNGQTNNWAESTEVSEIKQRVDATYCFLKQTHPSSWVMKDRTIPS